jgi:hypothetical protein
MSDAVRRGCLVTDAYARQVKEMHYDLWDVETGNYYGRFEREDEALAVVQTLVSHYGDQYVDRLSLGAEGDDGSWTEPIEGSELLARMEQRSPARSVLHLRNDEQNGATDRVDETNKAQTIERQKTA